MTPDSELELPMAHGSVAVARRFLRDAACTQHAATVVDPAVLLVSELVTNGIRYGSPPITVKVICDGSEGLRVLVSDHDTTLPRKRIAGPDAEGGRGMHLVDHISDAWGIEPHAQGKIVWFNIKATREQPAEEPYAQMS